MKPVLTILMTLIASSTFAQLKPVPYQDGTQKLTGLVITPAKNTQKKAGILILPAWKGIDNNSKEAAVRLAQQGYYAFIADIYGEGNYPKDTKEAGQQSGHYKKNVTKYQQRIKLAMDQLIKAGADPSRIIVIGYCFGGTGALEAARAGFPVKGVVSIHGGLAQYAGERPVNPIHTKVLVLHGADDPSMTAEQVLGFQQEMRTAKADWQMIEYANAVHAFTDREAGNDNSKGAAYNELAAKRSWKHLLLFFDEILAS
ncbi:dienelactone hydrolase [Pedobacter cryoconitis]|uniref:Dienelactone hydrolase n=1 Tax=Pedobacter cryoconitis TaxID=188932 RepID=A0A7W8ZKF4_9SPHI|nr:dienelactone hydrolase family protein [Pedobacter cryoconitis]MBB5635682.1 dienelactone hydrolase [Pedobacter cryoconitis]